MLISAPIRRQRRLSLTPLIDVIFLLLFFFMLSSTFSRFAEVKLAGGTAPAGAAAKPDAILNVARDGLRLNGTAIEAEALRAEFADLQAAGASRVLAILSSDASSQDFVTIMHDASQAGLAVSVARQAP